MTTYRFTDISDLVYELEEYVQNRIEEELEPKNDRILNLENQVDDLQFEIDSLEDEVKMLQEELENARVLNYE